MQIDYRRGLYIATDVPTDTLDAMLARGWRFSQGRLITSHIKNVAPYSDHAVGEAQKKVEPYVQQRLEKLKPSFALEVDQSFPAPEGLAYRPYQQAGIAYGLNREHVLIGDAMRLGKAQPLEARLLTPTGWSTIGEAYIGMPIIGADGQTHYVTGVFPQGVIDTYRVTLFDGRQTTCSGDHLWSYLTSKGNLKTKPLSEILAHGLSRPHKNNCYRYILPTMRPARFAAAEVLPLPPYIVGVLIGDGALTGTSIVFSAGVNKSDILSRVRSLLPDDMTITGPKGDMCEQWGIVGKSHKHNPALDAVRSLGMNVLSKEKSVPPSYLFADTESRLELLRGLLDTDGSCRDNRTIFHSCSEKLAHDVAHLARSLGGLASVRTYDRSSENKPIEYQVRVNIDVCPFHLSYKKIEWGVPEQKRGPAIVKIEKIKPREQRCISVSAPDHLYVTDDFIVTHNTIQGIGIANATTDCRRVLTVGPATSKINWLREWTKWNNKDTKVHLVDAKRGWDDEADNVIINYDILNKWRDKLLDRKWDQVIFDESHYLKGPDSQRTKMSFEIKAHRQVLLSGTPLYTRPRDLWTTVRRCDRWGLGANEFGFLQRYCGAKQDPFTNQWTFDDGSNLEELQGLLRERFMIRREKGDVVTELPPNRQTVVIPADKFETLLRKEKAALNTVAGRAMALSASDGSLADWLEQRPELDGIQRDDAPVVEETKLSSVRKELAVAKIPFVVEHIEALLQTEKKVVVFAHHREVVEALANAFSLYGAVKLYGGMSTTARQSSIDRFCSDDNCRVFIGNIIAAGQAIDLSVADVAVFAELSWVPSEMDQAEERIWSVMKEWSVSIYRIMVEGSLDEVMSIVLDKRQKDITKTMRIKALI